MGLVLRQPCLDDEAAFMRAYEATKVSDPNFAHFYHSGMDYREWIKVLKNKVAGIDLEAGHGPSTFLLAWAGKDIVGRLTFRHSLEESLLKARGNMGYVVLPEYRLRGYATEMLRLALPIAKGSGLKRVLLTCDEGNVGSQKTIERCGGVFEGLHHVPGESVAKMMYGIRLDG